jgi:hypothetical protein
VSSLIRLVRRLMVIVLARFHFGMNNRQANDNDGQEGQVAQGRKGRVGGVCKVANLEGTCECVPR